MKRTALLLAVFMLGISTLAFGWGNATHVYLANRLGAKLGPVNLQEMYGALTPDVFNFMFDANGQFLSNKTHFDPKMVYNLARTPETKAIAFGFMTHNNVYGADLTAHGSPDNPNPIWPATKPGWVIKYGNLAAAKLITPLSQILMSAKPQGLPEESALYLASLLAPQMGHDLVETAVDLLIKKRQDPLIGLRMAIAARARTPETGELLAKAYAQDLSTFSGMGKDDAKALIIGAEAAYQQAMDQYGQAFMLPEGQLIPLLAQQSASIAEQLIEVTMMMDPDLAALLGHGQSWDVTVNPSIVVDNIKSCMALVKDVYSAEIERTYLFTATQLALHHINTVPFCAMLGKENDPAAEQIGQEEQLAAPASFGLEQNYPNPFNPSTEIRYQLGSPGQVSLKIFNMIGQEVAVLVNDVQEAGSHQVRWDAGGLPSGNYFYRLDASGAVSTKRMTLVK
jgi:hypothetical protein